ncbi:hypothetical protein J40TS1_34150 [Paenibacillus montaniterrae]|uniref:Phage portal protein n=1 Tax=Paenibacillus montaniterrae TaxID=429341 RepID=A0A919YPQ1_9BACL|nr:phage portal protein [Paenibacillus montaniterrae]GIP17773.1 hypothetical protein J40TS1_34150 [Paenibacillus montaniterrae]
MGVWQRIANVFRPPKQEETITAAQIIDLLRRGIPLLSFGRNLYDTPEVRTAINFIAEKVGSVPFYHAKADDEGNVQTMKSSVQYVLAKRANPLQTPQVFWTLMVSRLLIANNAYAFPDWDDNGNLRAIYPLPFSQHEFQQDEDGNIVIYFPEAGAKGLFYYEDIIHFQRFPTLTGGAPNQATRGYMEIVNTLQSQAVNDSKNSQRIAALLINKSQLKGSDMKKKLEEFKELFLTSENTTGFGMVGPEYEVHNLDLKMQPLNKEVLNEVVDYLYTYFGGSRDIFTHSATEIQIEQFISNTIMPIVFQIEEEMTYKIFTRTEMNHHNKVLAELIDLEISTLSARTAFFKEMMFASVMTRNEVRKRIGLPKGPKMLDEYMESKNFQTLKPGVYSVEGGEEDDEQGEK